MSIILDRPGVTDDERKHRAELVQRATDLIPLLQKNTARADQDRRLPEENIKAIQDVGLFRMLQPKRFRGLETDFRTKLEVDPRAGPRLRLHVLDHQPAHRQRLARRHVERTGAKRRMGQLPGRQNRRGRPARRHRDPGRRRIPCHRQMGLLQRLSARRLDPARHSPLRR